MSRKEAFEDGIPCEYRTSVEIPYYRNSPRWIYLVPCNVCGRTFETVTYTRKQTFRICPECHKTTVQAKRNMRDAVYRMNTTTDERRFDSAVSIIKRQAKHFDQYEKAINGAKKAMTKYGSVPEAVTAIELLHLGFPFVPQQKVGRYTVDFYIPKIPLVLEVDGTIYHQKANKERDAYINLVIGNGVRISHVPAEKIMEDLRIIKCVLEKKYDESVIKGRFAVVG